MIGFIKKHKISLIVGSVVVAAIAATSICCAVWLDKNAYHPWADKLYPQTSLDYFTSLDSETNEQYYLLKICDSGRHNTYNSKCLISFLSESKAKQENRKKTYVDKNFQKCDYRLFLYSQSYGDYMLTFTQDYSRMSISVISNWHKDDFHYERYYKIPSSERQEIKELWLAIDDWELTVE